MLNLVGRLVGDFRRIVRVPVGYSIRRHLPADVSSGFTVAVVALPLGLVVAIAAGARPETGLMGIVAGGAAIALLSPSRFQIGGPTEACILVSVVVIESFGYGGLLTATLMAGALLALVAAFRIGFLVESMPQAVVTGFVGGMGIVIFAGQLVPFLGLAQSAHEHAAEGSHSHNFVFIVEGIAERLGAFDWTTTLVGTASLATIFLGGRFLPRLPGYALALVGGSLLTLGLDLQVATIGTAFVEIPNRLPFPVLPGLGAMDELAPYAIAIAFLASSESILSSSMTSRARGTAPDADREFLALGIGNAASALWGGLPVGGCVARTATCLSSGARSQLAGLFHALFVAVFVIAFAGALVHVPLASLAAVLLVVSWRMVEVRRLHEVWRAPAGERVTLLATLGATLFWDIRWVIPVGVALAAIIFVRRISMIFQVRRGGEAMLDSQELFHIGPLPAEPPSGVEAVNFRGALFYGTVNAVSDLLSKESEDLSGCVFGMRHVYFIDPSACIALSDLIARLVASGTHCYFWGIQPEAAETMRGMGIVPDEGVNFFLDPESALEAAAGRARAVQS